MTSEGVLDPYFGDCKVLDFFKAEGFDDEPSYEYAIDLDFKMLYCSSKITGEMQNSSVASYLEFNEVSKTELILGKECIQAPCTKSEIFMSKCLEKREKSLLMRFLLCVMRLKAESYDVNSTRDFDQNFEVDTKDMAKIKSHALKRQFRRTF